MFTKHVFLNLALCGGHPHHQFRCANDRVNVHIYIYICVCVCVCVYIYIYTVYHQTLPEGQICRKPSNKTPVNGVPFDISATVYTTFYRKIN